MRWFPIVLLLFCEQARAQGKWIHLRPGAAILHGGAVFALAAALFYALFQITTRKLAAEDPRVTLFYPALAGSALMTLWLPWVDWPRDMPWRV